MSIFRRPRGLRTRLLGVAILAGATACQDNRTELLTAPRTAPADASATSAQGPTAAVALTTASAVLTQTGTTGWTLAKTGAVDATSKTVTWTITATKGTTTAGQLVVSGLLAVTNTGTAGATIGNIVVLLQQKSGSNWVSKSADVADATHGDAATTANIDPKASSENLSTVIENAASGSLQFMDAHSNTLFSLQPEQTIAPNATVTLLFSARFDNTALKLPVGQAVRAEVIVSFGHSTANKPSAQNVDINGNGSIDADEAWVRSVPARLGLTVPAQQSDNGTLTINDVASNITTTGDATFTNPQFNLGTTSGTVTVSYDGGANGGKITNCATGTGSGTTVTVGGFTFPVDGSVGLQACNTQDVGATPACTPGALGCGWSDGQMVSYGAGEYGSSTGTAETLLINSYSTVYNSTGGAFIIGDQSKFYEGFDSGNAVHAYLPQSGAAGVLDAILFDPTNSSSGRFGGDVAALKLNVDFSDAGVLGGSANLKFGDLLICNLSTPSGLNGMTVRQFLSAANSVLGATSSAFTAADLDAVAVQVNASFDSGSPSTFAQTSLVNGTTCGWKNGDLTTYDESAWGDPTTSAGTNLTTNYNSVYASTLGIVEVGIPGTSGFSMRFSSAAAVDDYLPALGTPASLDADLLDPVTSSAGQFGGSVLALRLNIDFSDANDLASNSGTKFGDLTLCGFTSLTALNGSSVRQFASTVNTLLGGGSATYGIAQLDPVTSSLNQSFSGGIVSTFAQTHLVKGACP